VKGLGCRGKKMETNKGQLLGRVVKDPGRKKETAKGAIDARTKRRLKGRNGYGGIQPFAERDEVLRLFEK